MSLSLLVGTTVVFVTIVTKPGPDFIKMNSCSTQLSMKLKLLIKLNMLKIKNMLAFKLSQLLYLSCYYAIKCYNAYKCLHYNIDEYVVELSMHNESYNIRA